LCTWKEGGEESGDTTVLLILLRGKGKATFIFSTPKQRHLRRLFLTREVGEREDTNPRAGDSVPRGGEKKEEGERRFGRAEQIAVLSFSFI